jgi:hypothetical protein
MNKRSNPTGRGIDGWKSAQSMRDYGPFLTPPAGKGIRARGPGIHEGMSLDFFGYYFENAAIVSSGWKASIPFVKGQVETVRCYAQAGK